MVQALERFVFRLLAACAVVVGSLLLAALIESCASYLSGSVFLPPFATNAGPIAALAFLASLVLIPAVIVLGVAFVEGRRQWDRLARPSRQDARRAA